MWSLTVVIHQARHGMQDWGPVGHRKLAAPRRCGVREMLLHDQPPPSRLAERERSFRSTVVQSPSALVPDVACRLEAEHQQGRRKRGRIRTERGQWERGRRRSISVGYNQGLDMFTSTQPELIASVSEAMLILGLRVAYGSSIDRANRINPVHTSLKPPGN